MGIKLHPRAIAEGDSQYIDKVFIVGTLALDCHHRVWHYPKPTCGGSREVLITYDHADVIPTIIYVALTRPQTFTSEVSDGLSPRK